MDAATQRLRIEVSGATPYQRGISRGTALNATLATAYAKYAELFRVIGVTEAQERKGVKRVIRALEAWRPEVIAEFEGIAEGAGVTLEQVVALNARTEIIALAGASAKECSTVTARIDGRRIGAQTWDWHIELEPYWHTQTVTGMGLRHVGLTEQGILAKIGVNEAGLALHFNILGHRDDGPDGVPMHVLSSIVLSECHTIDEAIALIREAPIASSSAFTMIDAERAVSLEISPGGIFCIEEDHGSVQRTNHFQHATPLEKQRSEAYEPDSSERLGLIRERLAVRSPRDAKDLVRMLQSGEGEPPLTCRPDMSLTFGDRWATLATIVTDPDARTIHILDGMPTDAETGTWRTLVV